MSNEPEESKLPPIPEDIAEASKTAGREYTLIGGDGKEYGLKAAVEVREWIAEGRLNAQSQIKPQGKEEWVQLDSLLEFAADLNPQAVAPLPPLTPISPPSAPVAPVYAPLPTFAPPTTQSTNGFAITGMILGILSILATYPCCGIPFNILGLIFSAVALAQIKANPQQQGKGMAIAGLICSILSMLLIGILLALGVAIGIANP
ncbi:MAG: DUF4190 domain-containing protein [Verrucomicrobiota bacterium]|nr:DUF4190 domain-containing protein [Verrucomicrobiota bacterium]